MTKCDICSNDIPVEFNGWDGGNNAEPVVLNGRCCNTCNSNVVVPARVLEIEARQHVKKLPDPVQQVFVTQKLQEQLKKQIEDQFGKDVADKMIFMS
tara:strand:+ start:322 stop:612 length:291 start_codon:yes stop_codon:yes gene_type:complete